MAIAAGRRIYPGSAGWCRIRHDSRRARGLRRPPLPLTTGAALVQPSPPRHRLDGFRDRHGRPCQRHALDPAPLLAGLDIDRADPASRVPLDRYAPLYNRVIAELGDEGFGLFSQRMPPGSFEFLCRGMLGAPTLVEGLDRARRFLAIVLPDLAVSIDRAGHHAELQIAETRPLTAPPGHRPGCSPSSGCCASSTACRAGWWARAGAGFGGFPFPRPARRRRLRAGVHRAVRLHRRAGCSPPASTPTLLDLPIRRDEAALASFLDGAPGRISMLYRRDRATVTRVRDLIRARCRPACPRTRSASQLHMSPRTLHRRLGEEGSSFPRHQGGPAPRPGPVAPHQDRPLHRPGRRPTWATPTPPPSTGPSPAGPACRRNATGASSPAGRRPDSPGARP